MRVSPYSDFDWLDMNLRRSQLQELRPALCDNRLREGNYAGFDGVLAVDALYRRRFPAILVTDYTAPDINTIRLYRRRIPVLVPGSELRPERIAHGFEQIEQEIVHQQLPLGRRPRRALVEVDEIVDGPRRNLLIVLPLEIIPQALRGSVQRGRAVRTNTSNGSHPIR